MKEIKKFARRFLVFSSNRFRELKIFKIRFKDWKTRKKQQTQNRISTGKRKFIGEKKKVINHIKLIFCLLFDGYIDCFGEFYSLVIMLKGVEIWYEKSSHNSNLFSVTKEKHAQPIIFKRQTNLNLKNVTHLRRSDFFRMSFFFSTTLFWSLKQCKTIHVKIKVFNMIVKCHPQSFSCLPFYCPPTKTTKI